MIFGFQCAQCGTRNAKDARFCSSCGAVVGGEKCGACGGDLPPNVQFCPGCGTAVRGAAGADGAQLKEKRWARPPGVFAARIEDADLRKIHGRLIVEPGTKALIFQGDKYVGPVSPGAYETQSLLDRLPIIGSDVSSSAVLIEEGDIEIQLAFDDLSTRDYQDVSLSLSMLVSVKDPEAFFAQLFQGRSVMTNADLGDWLSDEVRGLTAQTVAAHVAKDLTPDANLRQEVEKDLRLELAKPLERWGLQLVHVRFVRFSCPAYEEKIRKPGAKLDIEDDRLELKDRLVNLKARTRELENRDTIDRFQSKQDLDQYVTQIEHETGLKGLLRQEEAAAARDDFDRNELSRSQTFERLKFELELENRRLEAKLKGELVEENFQREARLERMRLEQRLSNAKMAWQESRQQELQNQADQRSKRLEEAKNQGEIDAIERETDRADAELGLMLKEKNKEIKRRDERERLMTEIEGKKQMLEAASGASTEALIATTEGDAGQRLADFASRREELGAHKEMSPEQLLALAAKESPEAAQAMAEKFKSENAAPEQQVALLKEFLEKQDAQRREEADRIERMADKAMGQLGAAAQAGAARPGVPHPHHNHHPVPHGHEDKVVVCGECKMENPPWHKFCQYCGEKF
jgi:hypothetical protein